MLNFDFLGKGLVTVSPPHFCIVFQEKYFSTCYILLTDHDSLCDCLYFFFFCWYIVSKTHDDVNLQYQPGIRILRLY